MEKGDGNVPPPGNCDDCFETTNNGGPIPPGLLMMLNEFLDGQAITLGGGQITGIDNVDELCNTIVELSATTTPATADEIRQILEDAWAGQGNAPPVIDRVIECLLSLDLINNMDG